MMIPADTHIHSSFSADSSAPMEAMAAQAMALGLKTICFTEHLDLDYPESFDDDGTPLLFQVDLPAYFKSVRSLQERFAGKLEILFGLEMGMQAHLADAYAAAAAAWPFDFLIASQHLVNGLDPYETAFWEGKNEEEVYRRYFEELLLNLRQMKDFDTAAHLDYIVRYGPTQNRHYRYAAYADLIDPILHFLINHDKCLEVNTAGLKYGLGETHPACEVLRRYHELGGRLVTIGSDAHAPQHIAYGYSQAAALLQSTGFSYICLYRGRRRNELMLTDLP